ncbi:hypothetical protein [Streptomyces sp. NPDC091371]
MDLPGASATHKNTGRTAVLQYFAIAVAAEGIGLVVPLDETTQWG